MSNPFDNTRERIGTYRAEHVGEPLREGLEKRWPNAPIEIVPATHEGASMFDLFVKTDPITFSEMSAFVQGFFTAYNGRHKFN